QELGNPVRVAAPSKDARGADVTFHTNTPPPPIRGALPAAQPIASPTIAPDAPLATTAHHLLDDTDAAIARQTLLQVASLPDRIDGSGPKIDVTTPRWNFEIPFVTPQGTAMAQFELSRDGAASEVEAAKLSHIEIGDEIPEELYKAVAEVLIFVLRLTGRIR